MRLRDENIYLVHFQDLVNMYTGKLRILLTMKAIDRMIEYRFGKDLSRHLVQPFLAKAWSR